MRRSAVGLVVRPVNMPLVIVRPATPGPASHPRVAAKAAGAGTGAAPSKRHSVRTGGGVGVTGSTTVLLVEKIGQTNRQRRRRSIRPPGHTTARGHTSERRHARCLVMTSPLPQRT